MTSETDVDVTQLTKDYIELRDARAALKAKYEEKDNRLKELLDDISQQLLDVCREKNLNTLGTEYGTVSRKVDTRYFANDWEALYEFIDEHKAFHLLERRVAKTNMSDFLKENPNVTVPGIVSDSTYKVSVRRKQ